MREQNMKQGKRWKITFEDKSVRTLFAADHDAAIEKILGGIGAWKLRPIISVVLIN